MAGVDIEESTISCVDAWIEKLFDAKTLSEAEVVQLCEKVCSATFFFDCCTCLQTHMYIPEPAILSQ
jgi:hypothetical protein